MENEELHALVARLEKETSDLEKELKAAEDAVSFNCLLFVCLRELLLTCLCLYLTNLFSECFVYPNKMQRHILVQI